jgi:hypothetical protein
MSTCKKLLRQLEDIPFSAECQTKESVVTELAQNTRSFKPTKSATPIEYHPMTICVTELSQFLGANSAHMVDFLTTVYDQDHYELKTKNKGSETIVGPYITLLACTTPSWITNYLKQDVISGGFSRRAIFVYETEKAQRVAFPTITDEMADAWVRVVAHAKRLMSIGGEFDWEDSARLWFEDWYTNLEIPNSEVLAPFYESKQIQVLKIAMLVALSESTDLVMRIPYLETALSLVDLIEENLERVFGGIGRNELNAVAKKVIELLHMAPKHAIPESILLNQLFNDANTAEIQQILAHLTRAETVVRFNVIRNNQAKMWIGLKEKVNIDDFK